MQTYTGRKQSPSRKPAPDNSAVKIAGQPHARAVSDSDILTALGCIPSRKIDLPSIMAQRMNERFGVPVDGIKVFRDSGLEDMGQRAYARGNEIHIAGNESASDERLMLHEATHVVQQGTGAAHGGGILQDSGFEAQANAPSYAGDFAVPTSGEGPLQGAGGFMTFLKTHIVDPHIAARDNIYNFRDDYDNMSLWERIKWSIKNPLARLREALPGEATATIGRNTERSRLRAEATALKDTLGHVTRNLPDLQTIIDAPATVFPKPKTGSADNASNADNIPDVAQVAPVAQDADNIPDVAQVAQVAPEAQEVNIKPTTAKSIQGAMGILSNTILFSTDIGKAMVTSPYDSVKKKGGFWDGKTETSSRIGMGIADGAGAIGGALGLWHSIQEFKQASASGNSSNKLNAGLNGTTSVLGALTGATKGTASVMSAAKLDVVAAPMENVLQYAAPVATALTGAIKAFKGFGEMFSAWKTKRRLRKKEPGLNAAMNLKYGNSDDAKKKANTERLKSIYKQAGRSADILNVQGIINLVSGGLKTASGAVTLGGVTSAVAPALSLASTATDFIGGFVTDEMRRNMHKDTVSDVLPKGFLEDQIKAYIDDHKDENGNPVSYDKAKKIVIMALGADTGTEEELFQIITVNRAKFLVEGTTGDDVDNERTKEVRAGALTAMGLDEAKDDAYAVQGAVEKLGMSTGVDWKKQMAILKAKHQLANPFAR